MHVKQWLNINGWKQYLHFCYLSLHTTQQLLSRNAMKLSIVIKWNLSISWNIQTSSWMSLLLLHYEIDKETEQLKDEIDGWKR